MNARTEGGATPLHRAAYQGHKEVVSALLQAGADPSLQVSLSSPQDRFPLIRVNTLQDAQGKTSAHKATEKNGESGKEVLELILKKYPNCADILDHRGKCPIDK